ncbi:galactose oxidase [Rhizophagus clarus]|uniref:Galactose oxidase n=1 Tax=Rhizophagus clarus TaxID=94130 RepID=A0A8H3L2P6_9GLOM|nr:galactose oxidase [Rhizophagus clarus]
MILTDLFLGQRRSEPKILLALKLFIMIILVACLIGYLAIIIIDIIYDAPIIVTSYENANAIRPPSFIFSSIYNFTILNCIEEYSKINDTYDIQIIVVECLSDTTNPDEKYFQVYFGTYQPSPNVFFNDNSSLNDYNLVSISLGIEIDDENYTSDKLTQAIIDVMAFDSDYDLLTKYIKEKRYSELITPGAIKSISSFDNTLLKLNNYILSQNQFYEFYFQRKIKEVIKPSWMNNFGIPPTYENISYIASTLTSSPLVDASNDQPSVNIDIKSRGNTVQIDKEVRTHTYLNGMGLMGGAWGLAVAIYALLFGTDTLRPWGIVQSYCYGFSHLTKRKLKKTLPIIPFHEASSSNTEDSDLSLAEKVKMLQSKIDSLELFLREYVVDVDYLDKIRDKLVKPQSTLKSTTDTMREGFDNLNTNSTVSTIVVQQQQEGLMITIPPNFTRNSTTSTPTSSFTML